MKSLSKPCISNTTSPQTTFWSISSYFIVAYGLFLASPSFAQSIAVDGSTPTLLNGAQSTCSGNCVIGPDSAAAVYSSGTGPNLFHSFSRFNIDTGATVTFSDTGFSNIFSRITGSSPSNIDGTLKVEGSANLFLLNSNGILFGENATLDIQGSFLSSTANSILFAEGSAFSADNIDTVPSLLTISSPVGLQFGETPGPIQVRGNGHSLTYSPRNFTISRGTPSTGLAVQPDQVLTLLGGDIDFQGGNLIAESGHIEVGSLGANASVTFNSAKPDWAVNYTDSTFQDVSLRSNSSVDVSGNDAGSIHLQGGQINLQGGSALLAAVSANGSGEISIDASDSINAIGVDVATATQPMQTGAYVEILPGATGDGKSYLSIDTPSLNLVNGSQFGMTMGGQGSSGTVEITGQNIILSDGSNVTPSALFAIVAPVFGPPPGAVGTGGNLNIETENLSLNNGGQIATTTFGSGDAGILNIVAKDINVSGFNTIGPSTIVAASAVPSIPPLPTGSGRGGNINIFTERMTLSSGGQTSVSTNSTNSAGNLNINASDYIELIGQTANGRSGLFASTNIGNAPGGNIRIETNQLRLLDGATINVSNFASAVGGPPPGTGPAGNISVSATGIVLRDDSLITADTVSGDRANINLQSESLVLREGSNITTNATGTATGGNINIDAEALIALENSDITANAFDSFGGRVVINAGTILGTAYREQLTAESDITATSALGPAFSGSVELNSPDVNPTDGLAELSRELADAEKIVAACEQTQGNTFVATGRGGLPEDASRLITGQSFWNDFRFLDNVNYSPADKSEAERAHSVNQKEIERSLVVATPHIVEARTWSINSEEQVVLGLQDQASIVSPATADCLT